MPALNEEQNIEPALRRVLTSLNKVADEFEGVIIDDGSIDRTGELADAFAAEDPHVRVLHNDMNVNYGVSLLRGFKTARFDWIGHIGMDLPLAPEDIGQFTPHFRENDVVVARRLDRSAHSPWRKVTSWANNLLLRVLFAPSCVDLNFTQFYRRSYLESIHPISTSPAFLTPELIMRAERTGRSVHEVDVEFRKRQAGQAHFGRLPDILWTLKDMLRLRIWTCFRGWER